MVNCSYSWLELLSHLVLMSGVAIMLTRSAQDSTPVWRVDHKDWHLLRSEFSGFKLFFYAVTDQRVPHLLRRSHSHRGERIGEASHPGPSKWRSISVHTWDQDGSELKNGFALLSSDPARVCKMPAATEVESWREATVAALRATFDNVVHQKVQTCGDGKCAIHARFGAQTSHG